MRKILFLLSAILAMQAHAEQKYKLENIGGKYVCRGEAECRLDDKETFGSAVLWALEQGGKENSKGIMETYDAGTLTLVMKPTVDAGENNYVFSLTMQVSGGRLQFLAEKIKCVPKGVLGGFTTVNFDKVNLEKKPKLKEFIDRFDTICDSYMQKVVTEIVAKDPT